MKQWTVNASKAHIERQIEQLGALLAIRGIVLPDDFFEKITAYVFDLLAWNSKVQLISRKDEENIVARHIAECLAPATLFDFSAIPALLDFGSGAGLPGIPLAILHPGLEVVLLEARQKKAAFLQHVCRRLGAKRIRVVALHSTEWLPQNRLTFTAVIARAVAPLDELYPLAAPFLRRQGRLLAMKGGKVAEEIRTLCTAFADVNAAIFAYPEELVPAKRAGKLICVTEKQAKGKM